MAEEGCENKMGNQGGKMEVFLPRQFRFGGDIIILNILVRLEIWCFVKVLLKLYLNAID